MTEKIPRYRTLEQVRDRFAQEVDELRAEIVRAIEIRRASQRGARGYGRGRKRRRNAVAQAGPVGEARSRER